MVYKLYYYVYLIGHSSDQSVARPIAANVFNLIEFALGADSGGVGCHSHLPLFVGGEHGK